MATSKRQNSENPDWVLLVLVALLRDVQTLHSGVFSLKALQDTARKVQSRISLEGSSFATKCLPRLGKLLDQALAEKVCLDAAEVGFETLPDSKLPRFLGELFQQVFSSDGRVLPRPCVSSIKHLRQILYCFYKYELPYDTKTEEAVLRSFEETEKEVESKSKELQLVADAFDASPFAYKDVNPKWAGGVIRGARRLLFELFKHFDIMDIKPRHGPGSVSSGEETFAKWHFTKVSPRIAEVYPLDAYFFASLSHVCDRLDHLNSIELVESPAKIVLVPKDSRGPRIISEECLGNQYIQQGLFRAIVRLVERHPLTTDNVHFTNQDPNQNGALLGSITGGYATLDLKEASDRISLGLVNLLFPQPLLRALMACRSLSTVLPGGRVLPLSKYAPMGSALCFPVLALTIWALLTAGAPDTYTRERILVFGDDVVVPTTYVGHAMTVLEAFGLKVNRDKSFSTGFFRESCGVDAYKGTDVTPVRFKTVWSNHRRPDVLESWCSYANVFYENAFFYTYELIAGELLKVYESIPLKEWEVPAPSLIEVPMRHRPKYRIHHGLQKRQWLVWYIKSNKITRAIDGWDMLLRYFLEGVVPDGSDTLLNWMRWDLESSSSFVSLNGRRVQTELEHRMGVREPFIVRSYTRPRQTKVKRGWR